MKEDPKEPAAPGPFWPEALVGKAVSRAYLYGSLGGIAMGVVLGIAIARLLKGI